MPKYRHQTVFLFYNVFCFDKIPSLNRESGFRHQLCSVIFLFLFQTVLISGHVSVLPVLKLFFDELGKYFFSQFLWAVNLIAKMVCFRCNETFYLYLLPRANPQFFSPYVHLLILIDVRLLLTFLFFMALFRLLGCLLKPLLYVFPLSLFVFLRTFSPRLLYLRLSHLAHAH